MATPRIEFSDSQIANFLAENARWVRERWRSDFSGKPDHYICESCAFVSERRDLFEIDHVVPCARGGDNIARNSQILCVGCNQSKKAKQFVVPGAGYAYRFHEWDRNPDHVYGGAPTVTQAEIAAHPEPFDPRRYS